MRVTDQEQIDMLKDWWKNYGQSIVIAILISLVLVFGWRYIQGRQLAKNEQASVVYQNLMLAVGRNDNAAVQQNADQLITQYKNTSYAQLAQLMRAQTLVAQNKSQDALSALKWVMDHSKNPSYKEIARLRAARILISQNQPKAALEMLAVVDNDNFQPLIDHVKGDAYMQLNNHEAAENSYQAAQKSYLSAGLQDPLLNMKIAGT